MTYASRLTAGVAAASALAWATTIAAADGHMTCDRASTIKLPDVRISEAVPVAAVTSGTVHAPHCKVTGVIGTEINFALLLPDTWNGKFLMGGGGGYVGSVDNQAQRWVDDGYATVGTDTGHRGGVTDASWALDNVERRVNFGYAAVHRTAEVAKAIVRAYYAGEASRNYFFGCSNGGRQALMEAQRFPDDFDAIVAGAPAYDFVGIGAQFIKDTQALFPDPHSDAPLLTPDTLKSVEAQVLDKCDALDGVKDGLIEDPRKCAINADSLSGLTDAQRTALKKVYASTSGKDGVIYPAQPVGSEAAPAGWPTWITGGGPMRTPQGPSLRVAFGTQFFKYFVFNDPNWDYTKYDITNARRDAKLTATYMNATSPDLTAFKTKGHKLLLWHGWSDPALTALASVQYYEQVQTRDPNLRDYFRMFMMPGVLHCGGGPGPDVVDWAKVIDGWTSSGTPPDRIVARKLAADGKVTRSRPLCPYPQEAAYKGTGSTDEAESFVCK